MKIAMIGIMNNPSTSINSHSAGWNEILRSKLSCDILNEKDNWLDYDLLIINHGLNFKKDSFNIIGGINEQVLLRCEKLIKCKDNGKEIMQIDGFQMKDFIAKRKLEFHWIDEIKSYELPKSNKLIVGDSHSISIWNDNSYDIQRNDGKTLFGFLKNPIIADAYYFGNIDIRFHLCRQLDPVQATKDLVSRYIAHAKINNAKVSCLLPVESIDRKIPGTGLYKGKPYYGSQEERSNLVEIFNNELLSSGLPVNIWPDEWYNNLDFYQNEVMEPRQSVHIRPKYYAKNLSNNSKLF